MLYPIVQINGDVFVSQVVDLLLVFLDLQGLLLELFLLLGELDPRGPGGMLQVPT